MKKINEIKPYTYVVKFKPTGKVYYGSRCQNFTKYNRTPAEDLWIHYTTSSDNINNLINEYGKDAFEYEVRRTFDSVDEMAKWETKVLTRCKVLEQQDKWLNGNVAGKKILTEAGIQKIIETHKGKQKTEEHKEKIRQGLKGKKKSPRGEEYRKLMSQLKKGENNPMYGKKCSPERAAKIGAANKGKIPYNKGVPMSDEQKQKLRDKMLGRKVDPEVLARRIATQTGKKRKKEFCPHCKRNISLGWYYLHGLNCRTRTDK